MIGINTIMKFIILIFLSCSLSAQRGTTGQEVFANRFPEDVRSISNSTLLISNAIVELESTDTISSDSILHRIVSKIWVSPIGVTNYYAIIEDTISGCVK